MGGVLMACCGLAHQISQVQLVQVFLTGKGSAGLRKFEGSQHDILLCSPNMLLEHTDSVRVVEQRSVYGLQLLSESQNVSVQCNILGVCKPWQESSCVQAQSRCRSHGNE